VVITLSGLVVNAVANLLLVPRLGPTGAGISLCLAVLTTLVMSWTWIWRLFGLFPDWRRLATVAVAGLIMAVILRSLPVGGWISLLLKIALGAALFGGPVWLLNRGRVQVEDSLPPQQPAEIRRKPRIWVIMLNYNGREDTLACLESVYRQSLQPETVLVIDNGSTDGLREVLPQRFPQVKYRYQPTNLGFTGGMNLGLKLALEGGAEFMLLPNNDTVLADDCLERLWQVLATHPEAGAVSPKIFLDENQRYVYFDGGHFTHWTLNPVHDGPWRAALMPMSAMLREITFINGCCPLFRREALERVGLMDASYFIYYEDADISLRLRQAGYHLFVEPQAIVIHEHAAASRRNAGPTLKGRVHPTTWYYMTRNRLWLLRKHGRWWQIALGVPLVLGSRLVLMLLQVLRGRPQKAVGVGRGLWAGLFASTGESVPALAGKDRSCA
jgi:GT2 family glycosyltransferase